MGGDVSTSKNIRPPSKERKFFLGRSQNVPPSDKYRTKLNVFYTCQRWKPVESPVGSSLKYDIKKKRSNFPFIQPKYTSSPIE